MKFEFHFASPDEMRHVMAALKAYPESESIDTRLGMSEFAWKIKQMLRELEDESKEREADGLPY